MPHRSSSCAGSATTRSCAYGCQGISTVLERDTVIDALDEGDTPTGIVIEMSRVGFLGSAGLSALIHACRLLQPGDSRVVLLDPSRAVISLLDTCGLTHLFAIEVS